jgi:phosphoribosylamine---glycine ligase
MRFLGVGDYCDLGALYLRLIEEGHEVRVSIGNPLCRGTLAGLVEQTTDWRAELPWIRAAGDEGIILFENVAHGRGTEQDALRRDGFHVIGGSAFGDRLENDRAYAQRVLADLGLSVARVWEFAQRDAALAFLDERPSRYVLKFNGPIASLNNFVGRDRGGRDVRAFLAKLAEPDDESTCVVLMEHIEGVEMGVGAYFNGAEFITPACLDWEHKHFFPGDLGELTGEMGTVVTYDRTRCFFERTLARMQPLLREGGYCGYINLNTIVNEHGIWPLEFTCRFGYPGFAILDPLQQTPWSVLFQAMIKRSSRTFATRPGFSVGVVLTTPPFPYPRPQVIEPLGLPVLFEGELTTEDRRHLHYGEVGLEQGELVTSGIYGWTMVVTGTGPTVGIAQENANRLADRALIPNVRYRRDIGARLIAGDYARVQRLGLLDPE